MLEKRNSVSNISRQIMNFIQVAANVGTQKLSVFIECQVPEVNDILIKASDDLISILKQQVESLQVSGKTITINNWATFVNGDFKKAGSI